MRGSGVRRRSRTYPIVSATGKTQRNPNGATGMDEEKTNHHLVHVEDYEQYVGPACVERVLKKAEKLHGFHVVHVNSTYYGGGVATILSPLTLLMNSVGIKTGWRVIQGSPDFFGITKKIHNGLQGGEFHFTERKMKLYEDIVYENVVRNHLTHNMVIIHDPAAAAHGMLL